MSDPLLELLEITYRDLLRCEHRETAEGKVVLDDVFPQRAELFSRAYVSYFKVAMSLPNIKELLTNALVSMARQELADSEKFHDIAIGNIALKLPDYVSREIKRSGLDEQGLGVLPRIIMRDTCNVIIEDVTSGSEKDRGDSRGDDKSSRK